MGTQHRSKGRPGTRKPGTGTQSGHAGTQHRVVFSDFADLNALATGATYRSPGDGRLGTQHRWDFLGFADSRGFATCATCRSLAR